MKPLDNIKTHDLLKKYSLKVPKEHIVNGVSSTAVSKVVGLAESLGFPVVVKIVSKDIPNKSEVGGVVTTLHTAEEVEKACTNLLKTVRKKKPKARLQGLQIQKMSQGTEIEMRLEQDAQFGPVISIGTSIGFAPFDKKRAEEMLNEASLPAKTQEPLKDILAKLSKLGSENPTIHIDLHPIIVNASSAEIVDAKIYTV